MESNILSDASIGSLIPIQVQNVTLLSSVFMMTFFTSLGFQGLRSVIGKLMLIELTNDYQGCLLSEQSQRYRLEDDPQCGLTTGGRSECWWDCEFQLYPGPTPTTHVDFITDLSCLSDCYPPDHCLYSVLADLQTAGGICRSSQLDLQFPGLFPTSVTPCEFHVPDDFYWFTDIKTGLCSQKTQDLIRDYDNCGKILLNDKWEIGRISNDLIYSLCDFETWVAFIKPPPGSIRNKQTGNPSDLKRRFKKRNKKRNKKPGRRKLTKKDTKLTPITNVDIILFNGFNTTYTSVPPLENTKHRYPWLCSLRSIGQKSSHFCAVTLLSRPPGPTVLVTTAHCTYICKSAEGNIVPNCCCPNVGSDLCTDNEQCGTRAQTVEMTGDDVEILCGEWDTATDTEEEYNVILTIEKITRHPDFRIVRGETNSHYVADDLAVFHVNYGDFQHDSSRHQIYPACLPTEAPTWTTGVHSGWSSAPPLDYVVSQVPQYLQVYRHFSQQWHYKMDITECRDPLREFWTGNLLKYPTKSYYPPGTVCATEINFDFCPTSGESGSPLMVRDGGQSRLAAVGLKSFLKGCTAFNWREALGGTVSLLNQISQNPAVYTKISCYLPWIAAQYNMDFTPSGEADPDCLNGKGDLSEVTAEVCRANPYGYNDQLTGTEAPCIFPFTLNGVRHTECLTDQIEGFIRPIFRCPIRTVRGAGPTGTDYTDQHLTGGGIASDGAADLGGFFCPTNAIGVLGLDINDQIVYEWADPGPVIGPNGQLELDTDNDLCGAGRPVFATCKNNCPGGEF